MSYISSPRCFSIEFAISIISLLFAVSCSSTQEIASPDFNPDDYYDPYSKQVQSLVDKELEKAGLTSKKKPQKNQNFTFAKPKQKSFAVSTIRSVDSESLDNVERTVSTNDVVQLELYIDEKGNVRHVEILKSTDAMLASNTASSYRGFTYIPAKLNDKPIKSRLQVTLRF